MWLTSRGSPRASAAEKMSTDGGIERSEKTWLMILITIAIIGNIIFLSPLVPSVKYNVWGYAEPTTRVFIEIEDYEFRLPEYPLRFEVGEAVEFIVVSRDVTYGFGVFREDGTIVFQMQVVPGYENRIVWVFDEPGTYMIRSTEYSGPLHPYMYLEDAIVVEG
jgi:cytochrome c oxidase subunit 2